MLLKTGTDLFVQIPDGSSERFLHRARVVAISESGYVVALRANLHLEVEDELLVYFDAEYEFVQQPARISALLSDGPASEHPEVDRVFEPSEVDVLHAADSPPRLVCLETIADPISAENQTNYRIRVAEGEISATLDGEACAVGDVSPTGFALFAKRAHPRGTILPAAIRHASEKFSGRVCIRSIRDADGKTRYGVSYVADPGSRSEIATGLRSITESIRRN